VVVQVPLLPLEQEVIMSLRSPLTYVILDDTVRVARAAFPKGNVYMRLHDALGALYTNA